jgi:hypothetical protein
LPDLNTTEQQQVKRVVQIVLTFISPHVRRGRTAVAMLGTLRAELYPSCAGISGAWKAPLKALGHRDYRLRDFKKNKLSMRSLAEAVE